VRPIVRIDLDLRTERRRAVVSRLVQALSAACGGSEVLVRGSLGADRGDAYSDIDLDWIVQDARFAEALQVFPEALTEIGPILLHRSDRDLQRSMRRRLMYVNFEHLPLFWRVDVDARARSVAADDHFDESNPAARGDDWSLPASVLANAIAAVKAAWRDRPDEARALLERGYGRLRAGPPPPDWRAGVSGLARLAAVCEPGLAALATRVESLGMSPRPLGTGSWVEE
jgi:hypothetical protein